MGVQAVALVAAVGHHLLLANIAHLPYLITLCHLPLKINENIHDQIKSFNITYDVEALNLYKHIIACVLTKHRPFMCFMIEC